MKTFLPYILSGVVASVSTSAKLRQKSQKRKCFILEIIEFTYEISGCLLSADLASNQSKLKEKINRL